MKILKLFLFLPILIGCEKYEQSSYPKLSGQWVVNSISFPETNTGQKNILSDTVIISDRNLSLIDSNGVGVFTHDWKNPDIPWHDKFIIGKTVWEFETNLVGLPDRNFNGSPFLRNWDYYYLNNDLYSVLSNNPYWNKLEIKSFRKRNYTIIQYGLNTLTLQIPTVWTMYRYNGESYFLRENIRIVFVRM